ncbi:MAG: SagB/ThcOx family dehydrogenase [Candidatus Omnitrophica bacterium]|nr:SagB/ThcOx family dehydrogenase [Candidatus Omnitrophota bacterium]
MYGTKGLLSFIAVIFLCLNNGPKAGADMIKLPEPEFKGDVSVEKAIHDRRSVRDFSGIPLSMQEVSQLLWAAGGVTVDGVTGPTRAHPSAGAVYPLEIYLVAGNVTGLDAGIYRYGWRDNFLVPVRKGDFRPDLANAALRQRMIAYAPASIVVTMSAGRVTGAYGRRGLERYAPMDAGHLGQNVHLQAGSMGLGTVMVGAFRDDEVWKVLGIKSKGEIPVYIMPVGRPRS